MLKCQQLLASSQTQGELDLHCFQDKVYWGRSFEICCGILLQFIFAYVKILLKFILFSEKYCYNLYLLSEILQQFIIVIVKYCYNLYLL